MHPIHDDPPIYNDGFEIDEPCFIATGPLRGLRLKCKTHAHNRLTEHVRTKQPFHAYGQGFEIMEAHAGMPAEYVGQTFFFPISMISPGTRVSE